jgi:hypothetical protein
MVESQPERQPAKRPIESLMGVGRLQKEIARAPLGVPVVPGFGQVVRFVRIRHRIRAVQKKHGEDQHDFDQRLPKARFRGLLAHSRKVTQTKD